MVDEWPIIEKVVRSLDLVYQGFRSPQPVIPADDEEQVEEIEPLPRRGGATAGRPDPDLPTSGPSTSSSTGTGWSPRSTS